MAYVKGDKNEYASEPKMRMRMEMDSISGMEDKKYRKERRARSMANIRYLEKHPALNDDKIAAALSRHAIKKEMMMRKAEMMMDEARDSAMDMDMDEPSKAKSKPHKMDPVRKRPVRY